MKRYGIVVTTINLPDLLEGYADNAERHARREQVEFIVIGDRKTPAEAGEVAARLRRKGFAADYMDIAAQEAWLRPYPDLARLIPYNSDNRRNIGYLVAAERGCDVIITIDDDNYVSADQGDYLAGHGVVGETVEVTTVGSSSGWFNICSLLTMEPAVPVYPRGYPYGKRWRDDQIVRCPEQAQVMLNAGLWLGDPDVDAVTRLTLPVRAVELLESRIALQRDTWSPINSQNTAFHRDILPCCYYVLMGTEIQGLRIDRYGDIWFGYLAQKVLHHLGWSITFGEPLADHRRNAHDLLADLGVEYWGMMATDALVAILADIRLSEASVDDAYRELARALSERVSAGEELHPLVAHHLLRVCEAMQVWVDVCGQILAG